MVFIGDHCEGFGAYSANLLLEDYANLCEQAGCERVLLSVLPMNSITIMAHCYFCRSGFDNTAAEIMNLMLITGKLEQNSGGDSLKPKNNSHGLSDMGLNPNWD